MPGQYHSGPVTSSVFTNGEGEKRIGSKEEVETDARRRPVCDVEKVVRDIGKHREIRTFSTFPLCVALHFFAFSISLASSLAFLASSFLAALATFLGEEGGVDFAGEVGGVEGSGEGVPATELISEARGCRRSR